MKFEYTDHHGVPITITFTPKYDGLMVTATYVEEHLRPEAPFINLHSWDSDKFTAYISVHHTGLSGFDRLPDGNDMIRLIRAIHCKARIEKARITPGFLVAATAFMRTS